MLVDPLRIPDLNYFFGSQPSREMLFTWDYLIDSIFVSSSFAAGAAAATHIPSPAPGII